MHKIVNGITFIIVSSMIFFSCFNMVVFPFFEQYRQYLIVFFIISNILILLINIDKIIKKEKNLFIISFLAIIVYLVSRFFFPDNTIDRLGATLLLINLILTIVNFSVLSISQKAMKYILIFISVFSFFYIPIHFVIEMGYNPNTVSTFSFILMIYVLVWVNYNEKHKLLSFIIFSIFFYFSFYFQCRSAIVGELFFVFLILSRVILRYKLFSKIFMYSTNILATILPFIFVFMWNKSIYFTISFLNKQNIYTGRERVWSHFLDLFNESPIFGIGEGSVPIPLIDYRSFTPHNFMFNMLVVYGIIIFVIVFFILIYVFDEKIENKNSNKNITFFIAYNGLIGIMFTSMFEIIPISYIHVIMIWFLLVVLNSVNDTEVNSYGVNIK